MASWITNLVKEIETVNKKDTHTLDGQSALPFMLLGKDGNPFTVVGFSGGCFFKSPFFTSRSLMKENSCAVLEVLAPCCCGHKLFRTKAKIVVNLNSFCGIEVVAAPVFDYLQVTAVTKDQICLPFSLTKNDSPKTICTIDRKEVQHAETISVHYIGADPQVELILSTNEEIFTLTVLKGEFRSITVLDLKSIEIATTIEAVSGTIEVQFNFCEKKNIYIC